jgi:hypothetical protein
VYQGGTGRRALAEVGDGPDRRDPPGSEGEGREGREGRSRPVWARPCGRRKGREEARRSRLVELGRAGGGRERGEGRGRFGLTKREKEGGEKKREV